MFKTKKCYLFSNSMNLRSVLYLKKKYFELVESANNLHIVVDHT